MSFAAIALCLVMSVILGGGAGQAHESSFEKANADAGGDRGGDLLEALTRRLLDHRLGAEERREIAAARRQRLAELMQRDPAQVLARALPPGARAALDPDLRALVEEEEDHDGTLSVLHADGPQGGAYLYDLQKPSGEWLSLHFAGGGPGLLSGARVRVRGMRVQQALAIGGGAMTLLAAPSLPATFGAHRALVILVKFQNAPDASQQTAAQLHSVAFGTSGASLNQFWREASYQQTSLTGDVVGPFVIPVNDTGCDYNLIASRARAAASLAGVALVGYTHLVYAFPASGCAWWGLATVGGQPGQVWINGVVDIRVLAHELGHNLGLYHSHALECGAVAMRGSCSKIEYGDLFDTMGQASGYHYNAVQKDLLGWLGYGDSPPLTLVQGTGTYTLDPYESPGTNPKALKVRTSLGDWLYIEYRRPAGFDSGMGSNANVTSGVLVHYWNGNSDGVYLLDMTPVTAAWTDPALTVGNVFVDTAGGVSIAPEWVNGTSAGVSVTITGACVRNAPGVSVAPAQQSGGAGTPLTYTVSVRNTDTNCGTSSFSLSATAPSGWSAAFGGGTILLGEGATGTSTLQLTSAAAAAPGAYTATVVAAGPTLPSSAPAGYVVAPAGGAGGFADGFDRSDASALGNGWSVISGAVSIASGEARSGATRTPHMALQFALAGARQAAGASFASVGNSMAPQLGVVLRYMGPGNYYRCYRSAGGASAVRIAKVVNGRETVLRAAAMPNPAKNVFFALSCQATDRTLTLQIDGVTKVSVEDATFASGSVGLLMRSGAGAGGSHRADNFSASVQ